MEWLLAVVDASWMMLVLAAPYILFGLAVAGLLHVLLPESLVVRWMGEPGLLGVIRAAIIGVPLPVCSCGVVPITLELRRKGASRPASQSFLITTPESSIDSIFLTWGMMGPVMAIARPIAAFFTAIVGGVLSIASARSVSDLTSDILRRPTTAPESATDDGESLGDIAGDHGQADASNPEHSHGSHERGGDHHDHGEHDHHHHHDHGEHDHHHHHHHCDHGDHHHDHSHDLTFAGSERARAALRSAFGFGKRRSADETPDAELAPAAADAADAAASKPPRLWADLGKPALRYGFGELLDDLAFWLVLGVVLAGVLTAFLPDNLEELGLGEGLLPMIGLLLVGIPLYMCASASTPIAAALMLKGFSPGAALVFLLAGPATNAATVLQLMATFGRRFVQIYVVSVAVGALACGLLLDLFIGDVDLSETLRFDEEAAPGLFMVVMTVVLLLLLGRSLLLRGAWTIGVLELRDAGRRVWPHVSGGRQVHPRWLIAGGLLVALVAYGATGFYSVPVGARGYNFVFGALVASDLEPGLRYAPPAPIGRREIRHVAYPRKSDIGFKTDLSMIERRRELTKAAFQDEWHSPVAAMNSIPGQASYLTGDGKLVELNFSVHYRLENPRAFFYGIEHSRDFVNLYAEAAARELVASLRLDELLTERRIEAETRLLNALQEDLDAQGFGIDVETIRIVDLHPPGAAVHAFREVSSAKEDRETAIHHAREDLAARIPRSRGRAVQRVAEAEAEASRRQQEASGESRAFTARAEPFGRHRTILEHLLWIESMERVLADREKLIVPPDTGAEDSRGITFWQQADPALPPFSETRR
ncbi:MAG: SO_0444 family Cu/Zn efflux transporter [Acidobacteriota bacterium]